MEGRYCSAFDACCRCGGIDRSAHWLCDEPACRSRYPDLTQTVPEGTNGYGHCPRHGAATNILVASERFTSWLGGLEPLMHQP